MRKLWPATNNKNFSDRPTLLVFLLYTWLKSSSDGNLRFSELCMIFNLMAATFSELHHLGLWTCVFAVYSPPTRPRGDLALFVHARGDELWIAIAECFFWQKKTRMAGQNDFPFLMVHKTVKKSKESKPVCENFDPQPTTKTFLTGQPFSFFCFTLD